MILQRNLEWKIRKTILVLWLAVIIKKHRQISLSKETKSFSCDQSWSELCLHTKTIQTYCIFPMHTFPQFFQIKSAAWKYFCGLEEAACLKLFVSYRRDLLTLRRKQKTDSVSHCIPTANVRGEKSWKATRFEHFCILLGEFPAGTKLMCFATTSSEGVSDNIKCGVVFWGFSCLLAR